MHSPKRIAPPVQTVRNASQTASFGVSPLTVLFDGTGSYDPEGRGLTYFWTFGDSSTDSGATTTHTYNLPGIYSGDLMVTDDRGNVDFATFDITVSAVPVPPAVWLFGSGLVGLIGVARRKTA